VVAAVAFVALGEWEAARSRRAARRSDDDEPAMTAAL
jgi:hypothetical protein